MVNMEAVITSAGTPLVLISVSVEQDGKSTQITTNNA